jgi:hypothetical protein
MAQANSNRTTKLSTKPVSRPAGAPLIDDPLRPANGRARSIKAPARPRGQAGGHSAAIVPRPGCPALPLADAELVAAGAEFRILLDRFFEARRLSEPNWEAHKTAQRSLLVPCCDDITGAMDPIVDRILALPATTIAGLAAKAEVARFFNPAAFSEDDVSDELGALRALVEAISAVAGRSPQVGDISPEGVLE